MSSPARPDPADRAGEPAGSQPPPGPTPTAATGTQEAVRLLLSLGRDLAGQDAARGRECLQRALDLAVTHRLRDEEGQCLRALGVIELQSGDLAAAERLILRARERLLDSSERVETAACENTLAAIHLRQGRTDEALAGLRANLAATGALDGGAAARGVRAETLEQLGSIYRDQGDPSAALRCIQDALELRRAIRDASGVARNLDHLGKLHLRKGQLSEARAVFAEAIEMRRSQSDRRGLAASLNHLASTLIRLGELRSAQANFEESRVLFEEMGQQRGLAGVLSNLGLLAVALGRLDEAEEHLSASLRLYREVRDAPAEAAVLNNLAYAAFVRGQMADSLRLAEESLALRRNSGLEGALAKPLFNAGRAHLESDRLDAARRCGEAALEAAERSGSAEERAEALGLLAEIRLADAAHFATSTATSAEHAEALALAQRAIEQARETGDPCLLATTHHGLGRVLLRRDELAAAQEAFTVASRALRAYEHAYERACLCFDEGRLLRAAGASDSAAERFRRAEQEFARLGNRRWRARCLWELAGALAETQPRESAQLAAAAGDLAAETGVTLADPVRLVPPRTSSSLTSLVDDLLAWTARNWPPQEVPAASALASFLDLVETSLEPHSLELRLSEELTRRWRRAELAEEIPGRRALHQPGEARLRWAVASDRGRGAAPHGSGGLAESRAVAAIGFELLLRRARPLPPDEHGLLTLATRMLEPALAAWLRWSDPESEALLTAPGSSDADRAVRAGDDARDEEGAAAALVGNSSRMRDVRRLVLQVAPSSATVLVLGESGTGKELVARALHAGSPRRGAPFVAVNCPSIPRDLMESELFGHERGAFTGAVSARPGKIEIADGGTLFLDEVADMDPAIQAKLLRFLEEREFERVGGQRLKRVDVRVVAATSQDLRRRIEDGRFREDLYYRLNVVQVNLPPLRERCEDVPLLVEHFLTALQSGREADVQRLDPKALELLSAHDWPGNVRELRNAIEHLLTVTGSAVIGEEQLPAPLRHQLGRARTGDVTGVSLRPGETLAARLREVEVAIVRATLESCDWNQSAAARRLGVTEGTVRARMRRYGLGAPDGDDESTSGASPAPGPA